MSNSEKADHSIHAYLAEKMLSDAVLRKGLAEVVAAGGRHLDSLPPEEQLDAARQFVASLDELASEHADSQKDKP